jgi:hypothetical protein
MATRRSARDVVRLVWDRWKVIAHVIGNVQARVLLTLFYFVVVPPFALIVKLAKDPLGLRPPRGASFWSPRSGADPAAAHRQF